MDELPSEFNPPRGYIVTANENNIPTAHPASKIGVGYEWNDPARRQRLDTLFDSTGRFSVEDSQRFQTDTVSTHATRMVKLLQSIRPESADGDQTLAQGLQLLRGWDGNENPESAAAALFEVWFNKYLRGAVLKQSLGDAGAKLAEPGDGAQVIAVLERPDSWMTPEQRDAVIVSSLKRAIDEVSVKLGKDMRAWRWGGLHVAVFEHPLQTVVDPAVRDKLTVGRWPLGGSGFTPMATHYGNDYVLTAGASFRMVLDVGNWDDSRVVNAPGQSGNPDSAHYRDLAPLWASGQYFPLLYTRAAVEGATESRLVLSPPKN